MSFQKPRSKTSNQVPPSYLADNFVLQVFLDTLVTTHHDDESLDWGSFECKYFADAPAGFSSNSTSPSPIQSILVSLFMINLVLIFGSNWSVKWPAEIKVLVRRQINFACQQKGKRNVQYFVNVSHWPLFPSHASHDFHSSRIALKLLVIIILRISLLQH